jgi:hypothetical protein
MRIPVWLTLAIATLVIGFGLYRLVLAFRRPAEDRPRRGMYALGSRTHFLIGIVYLLLGGALVATTFGWNPFGDMFGAGTEDPSPTTAPTSAPVPADQLPARPAAK